jgi:AcrR family transcriptional regulator
MTGGGTRLPASERRARVLDCACRVFSEGSYHGTTTAELARSAGVTEPILYRHFDSKRDLYLACLESTWERLRSLWDEAIANEPDPADWVRTLARTFFQAQENESVIEALWIQALTEASEDDAIRRYMRAHMREVHAYVTDVIERAQAEGGVLPERDARAEAWQFLGLGLLKMISRRLGGLVEDDFPAIISGRRLWLTGRTE